jgi:A/G-specific adenine glycosylase
VIEPSTVDRERNVALLSWARAHDRRLPWRVDRSPYRVLVSEIMLQQTQAERVVPYFERFMERFPTPEALAEAPLADVLREWNGLGYNRRAQRLQAAARAIVADGWPTDLAGLRQLRGVGTYTAAAIASLGFGKRVAAVDTNLKRVLSRWHGEILTGALLEDVAARSMGNDAGVWNEAMMDLGAALCRPKSPRCDVCPVSMWCAGPESYEPPPRQARFEGSRRQTRGAVIRHLTQREASLRELIATVGWPRADLMEILDDLEAEGLIEGDDEVYRLAK